MARSPETASARRSTAPVPQELSPRELRRRQRIEMSREQILDTAEELFGERGYHATGLKEVAERCEFSVGSLYSFFESKDVLYQEVLVRRSLGHVEEMKRIVSDPAPARERLIQMARFQIEYFRRFPNWGRLQTRTLQPGVVAEAEVQQGFREAYRNAIDLEAQLFADGQREGTLRAGDAHVLSRMYSALVTSFHLMDPLVGDEPGDVDLDDFLAFVEDAFAAKSTRRGSART